MPDNDVSSDKKEYTDEKIQTYNGVKHMGEINITQEMNRSSIWTNLVGETIPQNGVNPHKRRTMYSSNTTRKWHGVQTIALNEMDEFANKDNDDGIRLKTIS